MSKLTIVIPCFNEERTIELLLTKVKEAKLPFGFEKEIIVINDGSTDTTPQILSRLANDLKIITKTKNEGKGAALKTDFREASGDYILIQDADLEYDPNEYSFLLEPIKNGMVDIVFGSRNLKKDNKPSSKLYFHGGRFLTAVFNILFKTKFTDITTCYKIFTRSYIPKLICLPSNNFVFDGIELTYALSQIGKIQEVPISYYGRNKKGGKKINMTDGLRFLTAMLCLKFQ